jgi:hypothetical protein
MGSGIIDRPDAATTGAGATRYTPMTTDHANPRAQGSFAWRPFLVLFGAGLLGVFSLLPFARKQITTALAKAPEPPRLPVPAMIALALWQSAVFVALSVYAGLRFAPRLGLRSHLAAAAGAEDVDVAQALRREARPALLGALLVPALIALGERIFRPWTEASLRTLQEEQPRDLSMTVLGVLYGGITEELLMRWGLVSLFARLLQRLRGAEEDGPPQAGVMWGSIGVSAVLFGAGHLPALAGMVTLTPALVVRTIALNAAGGLVFGFLYWQQSLEAAMLAHGGSHVVMSLAAWLRGSR